MFRCINKNISNLALLSLLFASFAINAAVTSIVPAMRPFPQHVTYWTGTIKPNHVTQATRDLVTQSYYNAWKKEYLKQTPACGPGRYYIYVGKGADATEEVNPNTLNVSEGHGYGMLIFAYMAGFDPSAKTYFDGMLLYWRDHQARSGPGLMAWNQTRVGCKNATKKPDGTAMDDSTAATDGDLDIAYALLLADKQWGSLGKYNYRAEAIKVINAIMAREINPVTFHTALGDWVDPTNFKYFYGARSSDFTLSHMRAFQVASNDPRWINVINSTYNIVERIQRLYSPATGLLPDFIYTTNTGAKPVVGVYLESDHDGSYFNNACRTPWRIAMDYIFYGQAKSFTATNKFNAWIKRKTSGNPALIVDGYKLNGTALGSDNELHYVAPMGVAAMVGATNQVWLNKLWTNIANRPITDSRYFGNTLKMLALITMSGNAWKP